MPQEHTASEFLVTWHSYKVLTATCIINGCTFMVSDALAQCFERTMAGRANRAIRLKTLEQGKRPGGADCSDRLREWQAGLACTKGKDVDIGGADHHPREDPALPSVKVNLSDLTEEELHALDEIIGHLVVDPADSKHNHPGINPAEFKPFSCVRMVRFGLVGGLWGGATTFVRFSVIAMIFPGFSLSVAAGKTLVNQLLFSPVLHGGVLLFNEWGKTGSFTKGWDKLSTALLEVQLVTWATKIPLNLICFSLMPSVPLQALFMRTYDIFFYIYISIIADREDRPELDDEPKEDLDELVPEGWVEEEFVVADGEIPLVEKDRSSVNCCQGCCVM
eukprot:Hpha_TRINITY_DN8105_c0_g1::TRINITY_DN8105_c0_g1_i1::g.172041::m.172041